MPGRRGEPSAAPPGAGPISKDGYSMDTPKLADLDGIDYARIRGAADEDGETASAGSS